MICPLFKSFLDGGLKSCPALLLLTFVVVVVFSTILALLYRSVLAPVKKPKTLKEMMAQASQLAGDLDRFNQGAATKG